MTRRAGTSRTRRFAAAAGALAVTALASLALGAVPTPAAGATAPATPTGPASGFEGVDGSATPTSFWLATADGGVWAFGAAPILGNLPPGTVLAAPMVGISPTASGRGFWEVGADGGIFTYGDAGFYGSMGGHPLNQPIVGMAPTPSGHGYWEVASDGGIFTFGDGQFYGSMGGHPLNQPIVGMAPTPSGHGYWMVASDGGIFTFGDGQFYGSTGGTSHEPTEKVVPTTDGLGYWIVDQNGTTHPFGDAAGAPPVQGLLFHLVTPGDAAVRWAFEQIGKPYIWGGNGPDGFDCSGLALASWENGAGVSFARVADNQYETAGVPVALTDLQAGDLVFWGTDTADWTTVYHTAIVVGGGSIVEATGTAVQLNALDQWGSSDVMPNGRRP